MYCHCYHMLMNQHASDNGSLDDLNAHFSITHKHTHTHNHNRDILFKFHRAWSFFHHPRDFFRLLDRASDSDKNDTIRLSYICIHFIIHLLVWPIQSSLRTSMPAVKSWLLIQIHSYTLTHTYSISRIIFIFREFHVLR